MTTMFYIEDLTKPCILIPVSSKLVEKYGSCVRLNICNWAVMEAPINVTQPNQKCVIKIKDKTMEFLQLSLIKHFLMY